jgi:hypothetical protein
VGFGLAVTKVNGQRELQGTGLIRMAGIVIRTLLEMNAAPTSRSGVQKQNLANFFSILHIPPKCAACEYGWGDVRSSK